MSKLKESSSYDDLLTGLSKRKKAKTFNPSLKSGKIDKIMQSGKRRRNG